MKAVNCKTEYRKNPMGIDAKNLYLSWQCQDGEKQSAYQIQVMHGKEIRLDTGKVAGKQMHALVKPNHQSREQLDWYIRLWDEGDQQGEWSEKNSLEYGLLDAKDWEAKWIGPREEENEFVEEEQLDPMNRQAFIAWKERKHKKKEKFHPHQPAVIMRKKFDVDAEWLLEKARIYVSACGLYELRLNGKLITEDVLTPGVSNYQFEIPYQTYSLNGELLPGENELILTLGDGWYRSSSGVDGDRGLYGNRLAAICQLEIAKKAVVTSDESWEYTTQGPLQQNDLQHGEVYDARRENWSDARMNWQSVELVDVNPVLLKAMDTLPIRRMECFEGKFRKTPKGDLVVDFGQNLAGQISFEIPNGKEGQSIQLIHGETLDENGEFTQENFQDRKRHKEGGCYQTVFYTLKEGWNQYSARFTIMGFRYVKVVTDADLTGAKFMAHAVYSQMDETVRIETSNSLLNQLVQNAIWSQKGNFCDIPTDCPTRERAGWTGDAGIFAYTGLRLMESVPVWRKWLRQCRYGQHKNGKISNIAPPNNRPGFFANLLAGSVAWGDASIIVPWEIYQLTGDRRILEENYEMMCNWYAFLEKEARKRKWFQRAPKGKHRNYLMEKGMNYGEWCEPGRSAAESMKDGNYDVATAYFSYSGQLLAKIAKVLKKSEQEIQHFENVSELARKAFQEAFTEEGYIHSKRQCQYVRPMTFRLLDKDADEKAAKDLAGMTREAEGRLNTGFLTTPEICRQLANRGYEREAYQILLNQEMPGWLYEVKQGATTVWENWDGIQAGQSPKASLNHYSYGAIAGWILDGICGIQYRDGEIILEPKIFFGDGKIEGLTYAKASYDSPVGRIALSWKLQEEQEESRKESSKKPVRIQVAIPPACQARLILPGKNGESEQYMIPSGKTEMTCWI